MKSRQKFSSQKGVDVHESRAGSCEDKGRKKVLSSSVEWERARESAQKGLKVECQIETRKGSGGGVSRWVESHVP